MALGEYRAWIRDPGMMTLFMAITGGINWEDSYIGLKAQHRCELIANLHFFSENIRCSFEKSSCELEIRRF